MVGTLPSRRRLPTPSGSTVLSGSRAAARGADEPEGGTETGGTVSFACGNTATTEPGKSLFPQVSEAFTVTHPNSEIVTMSLENEAFRSKPAATTSPGRLPDVFQTWVGGVLRQRADAGRVEDLTDLLDWPTQVRHRGPVPARPARDRGPGPPPGRAVRHDPAPRRRAPRRALARNPAERGRRALGPRHPPEGSAAGRARRPGRSALPPRSRRGVAAGNARGSRSTACAAFPSPVPSPALPAWPPHGSSPSPHPRLPKEPFR